MSSASSLDRVLSCPTLPTLPAVAVRVLELTRDPNVTVAKLAQLVQADPSLSAKVLRTVNSSLFGLPAPCSKIDRALGLLGLNTIKSLVLGFTLVESTRNVPGDKGLDLTRHWRRATYAASAARHVASVTGVCDADETFTAAMLQDIGMMAALTALADEYALVLENENGDHVNFPAQEVQALGFDHAQVGACLARKWKLPDHLVDTIAFHHDPTLAPLAARPLAETVWLGMLVAEALSPGAAPGLVPTMMVALGRALGVAADSLAPVLSKITDGANALAKAFDQNVGAAPNVRRLLAEASEQLLETQMQAQQETSTLQREKEELSRRASTDALTGARNRSSLESEGPAAFAAARDSGAPFAALFIDADKFKSVNDSHGHPAGDAVLIELAARLREVVAEPARVYRYGGEEFAVLAPGLTREAAAALGEAVRARVERTPFDLSRVPGAPAALRVTVSVGFAALESRAELAAGSLQMLLKTADEGVYKAKAEGRNRVRSTQPAPLPLVPPAPPFVLLVEDDPFCARLLQSAIQKATGLAVTWVQRAEDAVRALVPGHAARAVVCEMSLEGRSGLDVVEHLRTLPPAAKPPAHVVTRSSDQSLRARCLAAGAATFVFKHELGAELPRWCRQLGESVAAARAA